MQKVLLLIGGGLLVLDLVFLSIYQTSHNKEFRRSPITQRPKTPTLVPSTYKKNQSHPVAIKSEIKSLEPSIRNSILNSWLVTLDFWQSIPRSATQSVSPHSLSIILKSSPLKNSAYQLLGENSKILLSIGYESGTEDPLLNIYLSKDLIETRSNEDLEKILQLEILRGTYLMKFAYSPLVEDKNVFLDKMQQFNTNTNKFISLQ